jgi:uncharacterized membrane protein (UPF0127 family)
MSDVAASVSVVRRVSVGSWVVWIPETLRERARGLIGRSGLEPTEGLLLEHSRSVHTFGMRFAIDAVLLDRNDHVVRVVRMRPRRVLLPRPGVRHILEVAAGCGPVVSAGALAVRTTRGGRGSARPRRTGEPRRRRTRP